MTCFVLVKMQHVLPLNAVRQVFNVSEFANYELVGVKPD